MSMCFTTSYLFHKYVVIAELGHLDDTLSPLPKRKAKLSKLRLTHDKDASKRHQFRVSLRVVGLSQLTLEGFFSCNIAI